MLSIAPPERCSNQSQSTNQKEEVMKKELKRSVVLGVAVLAAMLAFGAAAQACRVEDEPGLGRHRGWGPSKYHFLSDSIERDSRPFGRFLQQAWEEDDSDRAGGFWNVGRLGKIHHQMFDRPLFGWVPFESLGAKWRDRLDDWNLEGLMDRIEESPAFVFFGGFMRPMFVALVFPLWSEDPAIPPGNDNGGTHAPIPAAALLLGTGLVTLGVIRRRQRLALR
jgi:hypothetical protein